MRVLLALLLLGASSLDGAPLREARITRVVKEVKLLLPEAAPRLATLRDLLPDGAAVRTGAGARSELALANQTIARLGANTVVSLSEGSRTMNLREGAMLFQIPRGGRETKIKSAAITAASRGASGVIERHAQLYLKLMLLEGEIRVYLPNQIGESLVMHAGQILITRPDAAVLPDPSHFDIARAMNTSLLVREFHPLPSLALIESEQRKQADWIRKGKYVPSNLVIFGRGTLVSLVDPAALDQSEQRRAADAAP